MTTLIGVLKKETESLKSQYVEMTKDWAKKSFERMINSDFLYKHTSGKYYKQRFGATKAEDAMINRCATIVNNGVDAYIAKAEKEAGEHYEFSIEKLAAKIESKALDQTKIAVKTAHVGVNIETVLTDGQKTVKAFTIIAEGAIQRPHYRYLIK